MLRQVATRSSSVSREGSAPAGVMVGVEMKRRRPKCVHLALALCAAALLVPQAASARVEPRNTADTITGGQVASVIAGGLPAARVITARRLAASPRLPDQVDRLHRAACALCGSQDEAEDLVQETFARVLARPRRLHRGDELPYLLGALRNT